MTARAASGSPARDSASPRASSSGPDSSSASASVERIESAVEAVRRILVGEPVKCPPPGAFEHLGRPPGVRGGCRLEQVHRDLLEVPVLAEGAQGLGRAAVKPGAAQDVALVVAPPRARARARTRNAAAWRRAQEPGAQDLVERRLGGVRLEPCGRLQRVCVVLEPEDRGGGDQLVRRRRPCATAGRRPRAERSPAPPAHRTRRAL